MPEFVSIVNIYKRIGVVLTILAVAISGLLIVSGLAGCDNQSSEEAVSTGISEDQFRENNLLLGGLTRELVGQDPVFKQAFFMLTTDTYNADQGLPADPENTIYIDEQPGQMLRLMNNYLESDSNYRNSLAALIFSALPMDSRQTLVNELGPDDPILSDSEVIALLPSSNQSNSVAQAA